MKWLLGTYTQRYNARHRQRGHLFQGRYKALIMDEEEEGYIQRVSDYIHLNPSRAKIVKLNKERLRDFKWSSYPFYISKRKRPVWLETSRVLSSLHLVDNISGRRAYERYLESRACEGETKKGRREQAEEWKAIRRGWYLGDKGYRDKVLKLLVGIMDGKLQDSFQVEYRRAHGEQEAERIVKMGLRLFGIEEENLSRLKKSDPRKRVIAWTVSKHTQVDQNWICKKLEMGSRSTVANAIMSVRNNRTTELKRLRRKFEEFR